MRNEAARVRHYLDMLDGPSQENAWHRLAEMGSLAMPEVVGALGAARDPGVCVALIRLLAEYRSADATPALALQLRNPFPAVWQAAVDALVAIGSGDATAALAAERSASSEARRAWIDEALAQIEGGRA